MSSLKARSRIQNGEERFFSEFLARFEAEEENLSRSIAANETRAFHFELETKGQAMEWHHPQCPWKGKFKVSFSQQDHDHCLVECEGLILVDEVPRRGRINSDAYFRTLTKIRKRVKGDRLTRIQQISCFSVTTQGLTQG
jgi:hypothetical protein